MAITRTRDDDGISVVTIDDGKANALDVDVFGELDSVFDACEEDAAIVLTGREGMFSAGLNTKVMASLDDDGLAELLAVFGRTTMRLWLEPRPVVAAATGHAIAGGTILAMACDHTVAAEGKFGWGLTETTIGFPMPGFVITLARGNVRADRLDDLILPGALVDPRTAVEVGFADEIADPGEVLDRALTKARALAELPRTVYAETKRRLRGDAAEAARAALVGDLRALLANR